MVENSFSLEEIASYGVNRPVNSQIRLHLQISRLCLHVQFLIKKGKFNNISLVYHVYNTTNSQNIIVINKYFLLHFIFQVFHKNHVL